MANDKARQGTPPKAAGKMPGSRSPAISEPGRHRKPSGKRSDPDYQQITAYIRRATHRNVKIALLQEGRGRQFSELVEELLDKWLHDSL